MLHVKHTQKIHTQAHIDCRALCVGFTDPGWVAEKQCESKLLMLMMGILELARLLYNAPQLPFRTFEQVGRFTQTVHNSEGDFFFRECVAESTKTYSSHEECNCYTHRTRITP